MKVSFSKTDKRQPSVSPLQDEMRNRKPVRFKIFRTLIIIAVVATFSIGVYKFANRKIIYTYGIVSGQTQRAQAKFAGTISMVHVKPGDVVKKGDVLAVIQPTATDNTVFIQMEYIRKMTEVVNNLKRKRLELISNADDIVVNQTLRGLIEKKQEEMRRIKLKRLSRDHEVKQARTIVNRKRAQLVQRQERLKRVNHLLSLDAAVMADVDEAQQMMDTATHEHKMALQHETFVTKDDETATASETQRLNEMSKEIELEKSLSSRTVAMGNDERKKAVSRIDEQISILQENLVKAEQELKRREEIISNQTISALFDGIVGHISHPTGDYVRNGETIVQIYSTSDIWVDAYIPPPKAFLLEEVKDVRIFTELSKGSIEGTLSARQGTVVKTPLLLQDLLPKYKTAKYLRLQVEDKSNLKPGSIVRVVLN